MLVRAFVLVRALAFVVEEFRIAANQATANDTCRSHLHMTAGQTCT